MSRADSTARRQARKQKSEESLREKQAPQSRRQRKKDAVEEARLDKIRNCPYHDKGGDMKVGEIFYKEGVDQPLMRIKWESTSLLVCKFCGGEWLFYFVKQHP
ncbi:MAG: hypothetical protein JWN75_215 [Candidatus Saccharibacteria bacterium]|nr:hypothetical protein [Candidatus Saccharibacteria bacterium]